MYVCVDKVVCMCVYVMMMTCLRVLSQRILFILIITTHPHTSTNTHTPTHTPTHTSTPTHHHNREALKDFTPRQLRLMFVCTSWDRKMQYGPQLTAEVSNKEALLRNFFANCDVAVREHGIAQGVTKWEVCVVGGGGRGEGGYVKAEG